MSKDVLFGENCNEAKIIKCGDFYREDKDDNGELSAVGDINFTRTVKDLT